MPDDPNDTQGGQPGGGDNANLKLLRDKANKADTLEAELAAARRETAILRAGIDADSPLGKMFLKAYEGDVDDTEALVNAAKEVGVPFRNAQAPEGGNANSGDGATGNGDGGAGGDGGTTEPTGTAERQTVAGGAPPDTGQEPHPVQVALDQFQKDMAAGMTQEAAAGKVLNHLANAAAAGDKRVIVQER